MNIIYFGRAKLMFTDGILPVLFQLREMHPRSKIRFIIFSEDDMQCLQQNEDIWEALQYIKCDVSVHLNQKNLYHMLRYLCVFAGMIFKKNLIISSIGRLPFEQYIFPWLKKMSQILVLQQYHHFTPVRNLQNDVVYLEMWSKRVDKSWKFTGHQGKYDYLISQLTYDTYRQILKADVDKRKLIYTGFVHRLPSWRAFLEERASKNPLINQGPYIFYVLSHLGVSRSHLDEPDRGVLLKETLSVLKKVTPQIRIIFKPHPNLEVSEFKKILAEVELTNYSIDYSHPLILASRAEFVIGNAFSTVMNDAYYFGATIVEYSCRDPEYFTLLNQGSAGSDSVDYFFHRDLRGLEQFIDAYMEHKITLSRDAQKMETNYPVNPEEFFDFLKKLPFGSRVKHSQ